MKYKHIEASREARLWISQVIVPVTLAGVMVWSKPDARAKIKAKASRVKDFIKTKVDTL